MTFPADDYHEENTQKNTTVTMAEEATLGYCSADVLLEIMLFLDYIDVLRLRQVSRRMSIVSRLRPVWECLVIKNAPTLLKKRIDLYTSKELEDTVIQHVQNRVDVLSARYCVIQRSFSPDDSRLSEMCLAPGGRWLLKPTASFELGVVYADLHDPQPRWRQLIPPASGSAFFAGISIDKAYVGHLGPTFHLVLQLISSPASDDQKVRYDISIWKVSQTFDSNGNVDGLTPERRFSRPFLKLLSASLSVDLQGPYLVLSAGSTCSVIMWMNADGGVGDLPQKSVRHRWCDFGQLLTERWLLVGSRFGCTLAIFDLETLPLGDCPDTKSKSTPRWSVRVTENVALLCPLPPPRVVGSVVHQIIPLMQSFVSLELALNCDTTPPRVTHIGAEHHHGPDSDGALSYSGNTFAYYSLRTMDPSVSIFDAQSIVTSKVISRVSSIALPFPSVLGQQNMPNLEWQIYLDIHSARLLASCSNGAGTIHIVYSFSA